MIGKTKREGVKGILFVVDTRPAKFVSGDVILDLIYTKSTAAVQRTSIFECFKYGIWDPLPVRH